MVVNSQRSAICYDIREKNPGWHQSHTAPSAVPNSQGRLLEMVISLTRNVPKLAEHQTGNDHSLVALESILIMAPIFDSLVGRRVAVNIQHPTSNIVDRERDSQSLNDVLGRAPPSQWTSAICGGTIDEPQTKQPQQN